MVLKSCFLVLTSSEDRSEQEVFNVGFFGGVNEVVDEVDSVVFFLLLGRVRCSSPYAVDALDGGMKAFRVRKVNFNVVSTEFD